MWGTGCRWHYYTGALAGLEEQDILRVVYEPTGGYELPPAQALGQAGLPACRVHPNRAPAYAQAGGLLAKTDRLDAQVLARYDAAFDCPEPSLGADEPARAELQDLLRRREQRVQERNRLDKRLSPGAAASARRHIAWLDDEIAQLDTEYQALLSSSPALSQQAALYRSAPGIGPLTAATLVAELPELGRCDGKALASQSAARHHPDLGPFYQGLCQRGKARKAALVAVMRKLLLQLNAVARRGAPWVAEYALAT